MFQLETLQYHPLMIMSSMGCVCVVMQRELEGWGGGKRGILGVVQCAYVYLSIEPVTQPIIRVVHKHLLPFICLQMDLFDPLDVKYKHLIVPQELVGRIIYCLF